MSTTPVIRAALLLMYSEFKTVAQTTQDDQRVELFIDKARKMVNPDIVGLDFDDRVMELACHFMAETPFFKALGLNQGSLFLEQYGRDKVEYQKIMMNPNQYKRYGSTPYGRMFEDNMKKYFVGRGLV